VAADLAGALKATLLVLHVINIEDYPVDPDAVGWEADADKLIAEERRRVEDLLAATSLTWSYHTVRGNAVGRSPRWPTS